MATLAERLQEFYLRLGNSPAAQSADEAMQQIAATLEAVEDDLSGIPRKSPPPPNLPDGRMYPPLADFTTQHADGSITARTRGQVIEIGANGSIVIRNKKTGMVDFIKGGT